MTKRKHKMPKSIGREGCREGAREGQDCGWKKAGRYRAGSKNLREADKKQKSRNGQKRVQEECGKIAERRPSSREKGFPSAKAA